ncbi:hypothetical protein AX17_003049 [Amanita inopinata Kibby_2008]|nr:hypothetical protein AX17_003049 [Amanita inopinata Kibby_2008]
MASSSPQDSKSLLQRSPASLFFLGFGSGALTVICATVAYTRFGKRIPNGDHVTVDVFAKKRWIKGVVTSVGDADNFRLFHTPTIGWSWPFKFRRIPTTAKDLKGKTIHIRIAGVDAPEGSHFGRPAQPFASESLDWLRRRLLGKKVYCQLIHRDQYSRIVSNVHLTPRFLPGTLVFGKSLPLEMLRAGWATTYEQAFAEYGEGGKELYLKAEKEARGSKRGMWQHGTNIETPASYKRRHAQVSDNTESRNLKSARARPQNLTSIGWLRRLWLK